MFRVALLAVAVLSVNGTPLIAKRQNDTSNGTSSEPEIHWTIFSPQTAKSASALDGPGGPTTYTPVPSPATAITAVSLEGPEPEETGDTGSSAQDSVIQTSVLEPVTQPSGGSLVIPVTDSVSVKTSFITVAPTAHLENSATYVFVPDADTEGPSYAPKMPQTEIAGSQVDQPAQPTDTAGAHDDNSGSGDPGHDDDGDSETSRPDATTKQYTQAGIIAVSGTNIAQSENSAGPHTQEVNPSHATEHGSVTTGSSEPNAQAHASPALLVGNTPLVAGGSPVTVDGTTYSLAPIGSAVEVNGETISFATDSKGQAVPVVTATGGSASIATGSAASQALNGLSMAPKEVTTGSGNAHETGSTSTASRHSTGGTTGTRGSAISTTATDSVGSAVSTSDSSAPATQTDNAGVSNLPWGFTAIAGAVGLVAAIL